MVRGLLRVAKNAFRCSPRPPDGSQEHPGLGGADDDPAVVMLVLNWYQVLYPIADSDGGQSPDAMSGTLGHRRGRRRVVPGLDGLGGSSQRLGQDALAAGRHQHLDQPPFEVLAVADHDDVHVGGAAGLRSEGIRGQFAPLTAWSIDLAVGVLRLIILKTCDRRVMDAQVATGGQVRARLCHQELADMTNRKALSSQASRR
jgi:hypothetical protein